MPPCEGIRSGVSGSGGLSGDCHGQAFTRTKPNLAFGRIPPAEGPAGHSKEETHDVGS